jgi:hypothetical protein
MYGVPKDLDLRRFKGNSLVQIAVGKFEIQFHFASGNSIVVQGEWELKDQSGKLIDRDMENAARESYRIHHLLGRTVLATELDPPKSISLVFDNGMRLTILDSSDQYESFSIQPGNIFV